MLGFGECALEVVLVQSDGEHDDHAGEHAEQLQKYRQPMRFLLALL